MSTDSIYIDKNEYRWKLSLAGERPYVFSLDYINQLHNNILNVISRSLTEAGSGQPVVDLNLIYTNFLNNCHNEGTQLLTQHIIELIKHNLPFQSVQD